MKKFGRKKERASVRLPKTAQQSIPIRRIHRDGIWEVDGKFSRCWRFTDINYAVADEEDKKEMLIQYCALEKALPTDAITKISIVNKRLNPLEFQKEMLMPSKQDGRDDYRKEYNRMLLDKAAEGNGIVQERYITVSVERRSIEEARSFFARVGSDLSANMKKLNSKLYELDNKERLGILHDFFRIGEEDSFRFDFDTVAKRGHSFKDSICPDSIQFHSNYFELSDNKVGRVLFLKDYPAYLEDSFVKELTELNRNLILSIDIQPIPTDKALKEIQNQSLAVETDITRWQNKQNQNNNFSAIPPMQLTDARDTMRSMLDDLTMRDQRMTLCVMTLVHVADSKAQLDADTDTIRSIAGGKNCEMSVLTYQQEDALNTVLPYGLRRIDILRTLTTESAAGLVPFSSQEIRHRGGVYYGVNATSRNLIVCDRRQLLNSNGFILGVSGSGKSFAAKEEITSIALSTDDDIIIVDPEREYGELVRALGGEVITISASDPNGCHINALDLSEGYGDGREPLVMKSEFIMSLYEQLMGSDKIEPQEKSIIDRSVGNIYREYIKNFQGQPPTLKDLYDDLMKQVNPEAHRIALALELFTVGSLNVFSHQTNINTKSRILCFDIQDLGENLKSVGLLVMLDAIYNRVIQNRKAGKYTHVYIDEIYLFFANGSGSGRSINNYSSEFLYKCWKRFRKYGATLTGITQNVEECLLSNKARMMFANSEFLLMLNQATTDREQLARLLGASDTQMSYVDNAPAGHGLIKVGGAIVPFANELPKNTELYRLMSTRPGED